jgi:multidrug resistance efflux pump
MRSLPRERASLMARLEVAKRRAKLGQDQIDSQQKLIATLFAGGSEGEEFDEAENRLRVYQRLQKNYVADVERIANALQYTFL